MLQLWFLTENNFMPAREGVVVVVVDDDNSLSILYVPMAYKKGKTQGGLLLTVFFSSLLLSGKYECIDK